MKYLILLLVLALMTSGCGLFNISGFVMPDDLEFYELVMSLDTPQKIDAWLTKYCSYKESPYHSLSPYEFWKLKEGDCNDFADFAEWVAHLHGIKTYTVLLLLKDTWFSHVLTIYVENGLYNYQNVKSYRTIQADNFFEVVDHWQSTEKNYSCNYYKIYDYESKIIEKGVYGESTTNSTE